MCVNKMRGDKSGIESEKSSESRSLIRPQTRLVRPTPNIKHPVIESNECTLRVVMAEKQEQEKTVQANNVQSKRSTVVRTSHSVKATITSDEKVRPKGGEEGNKSTTHDVTGCCNLKKDQVQSVEVRKYSFKRRSKEKREQNFRQQDVTSKIQRHQVSIGVTCHSQFPRVCQCHLILK